METDIEHSVERVILCHFYTKFEQEKTIFYTFRETRSVIVSNSICCYIIIIFLEQNIRMVSFPF